MAQITSGIRAVLSHPRVYDVFQACMGASRLRRNFVDQYIRPPKGARILDLGCGTADILSFLPDDAEYWGYDMSEEYVKAATRRFPGRGTFRAGIVGAVELAELPKMDVVLGLGVLHHLDDPEASQFLQTGHEALAPSGRVITIDPVFAPGQNPVAKFLVGRDRGRNVRTAPEYRALAEPVFAQVQGTVQHTSWIPYTHWIMECAA